MAEQRARGRPPAQAAQDRGEVLPVTQSSELMRPLHHADVKAQIEVMLEGSPLTFDRLVYDLAAYLGLHPEMRAKAKPHGAMLCLLTAARYQTTFGDGGIWPIPYGDDIAPQESEKFLVHRAREDAGVQEIRAVLVYEVDTPIKVQRDSSGFIQGFTLNPDADITAERTQKTLVGGFGVSVRQDGTRRIDWFPLSDLERRRNHSQGYKSSKSPMWRDDPLQGYERSIRAAMARFECPVRTRTPGVAGGFGTEEDYVEADWSPVEDAGGSPSANVAAELEGRAGQAPPEPEPEPEPEKPPRVPAPDEFPAEVRERLAESRTVLSRAYDAFAGAWAELPMDPEALVVVYRQQAREWADEADETDTRLLGQLRQHFWYEARVAGYPQPEK